jgi:MoxR-like ATPase
MTTGMEIGTATGVDTQIDELAAGTAGVTGTGSPRSVGEVGPSLDEAATTARDLHAALSGVLLGTPRAVTFAVVAALSGNHLLIEDVPGVGKTVLGRALATALGVPLSRIQGHPDLLPSDVTGVTVFSPDTATWDFRPGPIFGHVVLLDELNRTPPRTQSALLEAMEERQVSVDGQAWPLPTPHLVIGTQNPIGQLGTYPLVESQLDRFGVSTSIGYPDAEVEARLVLHHGGRYALDSLTPVADPARWARAIDATAAVQVVPTVAEYAVTLVRATRTTGTVRLGASPRAAISLIRAAQAYAVLSGRGYVTPEDIQAVAVSCLAHRLVAEGSGGDGPSLVGRILAETPVPPT